MLAILNAQLSTARAQGTTAFTYQGQLRDNGTNANGPYTMIFNLYDSASSGNLIGGPITASPTLANGFFTVNLDFGAGVFNGSARFAITRSVVAGGGATFSSSAWFQLGGTVAQPLAAMPSSARFSIQGGFWIWPAPVIYAAAQCGTHFVFSFQSDLGRTYTVQCADSLPAPNWQTLATVCGNGGVNTVTDSAAGSSPQFFRLMEQ
jgi:hypothetical protein